MDILTRWGFRMVRANRSRTITVILAVVGFFALWVCATFIVSGVVHSENLTASPRITGVTSFFHDDMFRALDDYLFAGLLLVMLAVLYSAFSVTAAECLHDFRILTSAGTTARQIRRHLLFRAVVLDLTGASIGIAAGLFFARLSIGAQRFRTELPLFFSDPRTMLMLAVALLLTPCTMALTSAFTFRRRRQRKHRRAAKKHGTSRHPVTRSVFGAGGVLGCMDCKKNRRSRVIFTSVFAVCLAVLAFLNNTLLLFVHAQPFRQDFDLYLTCVDYTDQGTSSGGSDYLDTLLSQNADRFGITHCSTYFSPNYWRYSYMLLDSDWLDEPQRDISETLISPPFERDGRTVRLCRFLFNVGFLDDASFDRLTREHGMEPETNGTFFCNVNNFNYGAPLKTVGVGQDVTMYFLPDSLLFDTRIESSSVPRNQEYPSLFAPYETFLRAAEPISVSKSFRVLGLLQELPFDMESYFPNLLFPARMYASFETLLPHGKSMETDDVLSVKRYYLTVSEPKKENADALLQALQNSTHFELSERLFGIGNKNPVRAENASVENDSESELNFVDLATQRARLEQFQSLIPQMQVIVLAMTAWILFVGILNTAHMNRLTRRREMAILDSVGMGGRQKTGMLLYESARYALFGTMCGLLVFLVIFRLSWRGIQWLLFTNGLQPPQASGFYQKEVFYISDVYKQFPQALADALGQIWWVFAVGAALIFALLIGIDHLLGRRSRDEELIQILKDDSLTYDVR